MGHIGVYALERIAESKALARASARRAEKQTHRRIAGDPGRGDGFAGAVIIGRAVSEIRPGRVVQRTGLRRARHVWRQSDNRDLIAGYERLDVASGLRCSGHPFEPATGRHAMIRRGRAMLRPMSRSRGARRGGMWRLTGMTFEAASIRSRV
jgi:hypothetical protein